MNYEMVLSSTQRLGGDVNIKNMIIVINSI